MNVDFPLYRKKISIGIGVFLIVGAVAGFMLKFTSDKGPASAHDLLATDNSKASQTYVLKVGKVKDFPVQGGTSVINIASYRIGRDSVLTPVPWTMTFSVDGGRTWQQNIPLWATIETYSGPGNIKARGIDIILREQPEKGDSVIDYDLSTKGGTAPMSTANCYLINNPGTYKIPLVYGNAIKNGVDNKVAYRPKGANSAIFLTPFHNHRNEPIRKPWLKENGVRPNRAEVLWQDSKGMITKATIKDDYLIFSVPDSAMTGNAVVAAQINDTVCWSWHLWLTHETLEEPITVGSIQETYSIAPINLGYCIDGQKLSQGGNSRQLAIRVKQDEGAGKETVITVTQKGRELETAGGYTFCTYYQWGRKDPEIPSAADGKKPRMAYDIKNDTVSNFYASAKGMEATILYPTVHFADTEDGYPGPYGAGQYNLWNATLTATGEQQGIKTVKTIYDPCPPGYCVPTEAFYRFITENGEHEWKKDLKGQLWRMGNTEIFFPAAGLREHVVGSIWYFGTKGDYWSSNYTNQRQSPFITFTDGSFVMGLSPKSSAYTIRPMTEE